MNDQSPERKTLNILHIDTGLELRGGQRQLLYLATALEARGHRQTIATPEESPLELHCRKQGLRTFLLPCHDPAHLFGAVLLRQQVREGAFDIIHAHDGHGQSLGLMVSVGIAVRRVATRRVLFRPRKRWTTRLKYERGSDAVIAVSQAVGEVAVRSGISPQKVRVIFDGVEIPRRVPDDASRRALRKGWGIGENEFAVGHVGYFSAEKGQWVAARAARLVKQRLPQVRFLLAGEGPPGSEAELLDESGGGGANLRLVRRVEDLGEFLPALDLFIMPSVSEGLGSSVLHAMAHGLPVVASRVGGLPEAVVHEQTGWLVEPNSPEKLATAIGVAVRDRERLAVMGREGRRRAESLFGCEAMVRKTESLYHELIDGPEE